MDQKAAFRHLTKRVALDKDTVTYRLLSRELGITVSSAKALMESYLAEPQAIERGVTPTWALSGVLSSTSIGTTNGHSMDVDSEEQPEEIISHPVILLVSAADLPAKSSLFTSPPHQHIFSLSPAPLSDLSLLATYSFSVAATPSAIAKWKKAPEGGYGEIEHEEGERRKKGKGTAAAAPAKTTTAAKTTTTTTSKGKGKEKEATTTAASKPKSTTTPTARPIGQLGGLFAKRDPPPPKVPAKRKASPPPAKRTVVPPPAKAQPKVKTGSNGIFADEELDSDEEEDDWDEAALREAEEQAEKQAKIKGKTSGSGNAVKSAAETKKEREKRELELMMQDSDDDAMEVDPPAAAPKKTTTSTSKPESKPTTKTAAKPAPKTAPQKSLNSFFKKG